MRVHALTSIKFRFQRKKSDLAPFLSSLAFWLLDWTLFRILTVFHIFFVGILRFFFLRIFISEPNTNTRKRRVGFEFFKYLFQQFQMR